MLAQIKQTLFSKDFKEEFRQSENHFKRNRKLPFHTVILYIANFLKGSSQDELDQHFQSIFKWDVAKRFVTRSAMCQARRKVSHRAFIHLLDLICDCVNQAAPVLTYHGKRVLAIDGSTFRLPDLQLFRDAFGVAKNKHGERAMARISILHDVLNRLTYDAVMGSYSGDKACAENEMAWSHLEGSQIPPGSLIILDRGYVDFSLLRHIHDLGHDFCIRVKSNMSVLKEFNRLGGMDAVLEYKPSKGVIRKASKDSNLRKSFTVRLVRQKIGKEYYVLMTTLLDSKYQRYELFDLYHKRWEIEESYKVKKCRMGIEAVSGTTVELVRQDFHAKVFAECLTAAFMLDLEEDVASYCLTRVNEYKISMTQAIAKMKNTIVLLFIRDNPDSLLRDLYAVFMKSLVGAVPGRKYARKNQGKCAQKMQCHVKGYRNNR